MTTGKMGSGAFLLRDKNRPDKTRPDLFRGLIAFLRLTNYLDCLI